MAKIPLTKPENRTQRILERLSYLVWPWIERSNIDPANIIYTHMPISRTGGKKSFIADFALPWAKIDIEVDGYWHNKVARRMSDNRRDIELRYYGWQVLRIRASTVIDHPSLATRQLQQGIHHLLNV